MEYFGIEIPSFKWSPIKYRYKEWAGLYKKNNKQIYVNRGLGHFYIQEELVFSQIFRY